MAKEIERKFLVTNDSYRAKADRVIDIVQGYLSTSVHATVRVRTKNDKGYLTVKSKTVGATRDEWEYEIPYDDALGMLALCDSKTLIQKKRYICGDWEVDEFRGRHSGLVVAEIELKSEDQEFELPAFVGKEVTGDPRYYNSSLSRS